MLDPTLSVLFSESVLSLYPILIKSYSTNLYTQTLIRFLMYSFSATLIGGLTPLYKSYQSTTSYFYNFLYGLINIIHVISSYIAFSYLPAGIAMSLFYTYPLWNIVGSMIFLKEKINMHILPSFLVSMIGIYLLSYQDKAVQFNTIGLIAVAIAALTETAIFLVVKASDTNPFINIHQLYLSGFVLLLAGLCIPSTYTSFDNNHLLPLILFNGILGFLGYSLRFWSIPKLSTIIYSILSLFGIISSFIWGYLFVNESIQMIPFIGGCLIGLSIAYINYISKKK
jgi:drug/metabolite transporter (DMT)-like permease